MTLADADAKNVAFLRAGYDGNAVVDVARLRLDATLAESALLLDFAVPSQSAEDLQLAQLVQSPQYDAIVAFNRVDALQLDDAKTFGRLRALLKSNGRVVFTLPVVSGSKSYAEREIKRRLADAGFRAEKIERFDALGALLGRRDGKAPSRKALKLYDWLFRWTRWLDKFLPGARLFVVATPDSSNVK